MFNWFYENLVQNIYATTAMYTAFGTLLCFTIAIIGILITVYVARREYLSYPRHGDYNLILFFGLVVTCICAILTVWLLAIVAIALPIVGLGYLAFFKANKDHAKAALKKKEVAEQARLAQKLALRNEYFYVEAMGKNFAGEETTPSAFLRHAQSEIYRTTGHSNGLSKLEEYLGISEPKELAA